MADMTNRKRREIEISMVEHGVIRYVLPEINGSLNRFREVLPDEPSPEWVDELIRLCETTINCDDVRPYEYEEWIGNRLESIGRHLAKRGEK